ncbi:DUF4363 family protein [Lentibacillus juripiscarius]|uniref:DUF4363 family protein n=1 Tax=Lentibacillus juripiscarius TaxID=257446 RepID=A0ABW5V1G5_9BACI
MKFFTLGTMVLTLFIFTGCSDETIQDLPITQSATEINSLISQSQWTKAQQKSKQVQNIYESNKWKYQLMGDETEYNKLDEAIAKLQVSIKTKDKAEVKRTIATIEHYVQSLYFQ